MYITKATGFPPVAFFVIDDNMKRKRSIRKLINALHLWVGIPSALILFVVCLSGTAYVFNKEITKWVDRDKFYVKEGNATLPAEKLIAMVEKEKKDMRVSAITIPGDKKEAWIFSLGEKKKKEEKENKGPEGMSKPKTTGKAEPAKSASQRKREKLTSYLVDPYTGEIKGDAQTSTSEFFNTIMKLHRWLLMDHEIGSIVTGVAAFAFLFLELSGLALWLPSKIRSWKKWSAWRPGFQIKTSANWKRINHDLHKSLGFYTFLLITIMAITGPVLGFEWYRKGFNKVLGVKTPPRGAEGPKSMIPSDTLLKPLKADEWISRSESIYAYAGDMRITLPKDKFSAVSISKTKNGFASSPGPDRLTLDQYSNAVIKDERFSDKGINEKISSMVKAIHTGDIFGMFSRIIYFIACLIATSLPVTGIFIWLNKSRKKKTVSIAPVKRSAAPLAV